MKTRSYQKELLDEENIPQLDLFQNLKELHTINTLLGGYDVVHKGIKKLIKKRSSEKAIRILDIGSGGGDTLKEIHKKFGHLYPLELVGVDLKTDCIEYSQKNCEGIPIDFIQSDYRDVIQGNEKFDIVITSLFCHHLTDEEIISLLQWMHQNSALGFVINDLHRHPLAKSSITLLTKILSKSYLVKNDAPLSVERSFLKNDWEKLFQKAKIKKYSINWIWAFRWLVVCQST